MEEIYNYYNDIIERNSFWVEKLNKRIHILGTLRLMLVIGAITTIIAVPEPGWEMSGLILSAYLITFIGIVVWDNKLSYRRAYFNTHIKLCRDELAALDYDFSAFDGAPEKMSADHPFSLDLDLFGEKSFFQSINRTVTFEGKEKLCRWLLHPLANKKQIIDRQKAVNEITGETEMRHSFYITGTLKRGKTGDLQILEALIKSCSTLESGMFWKIAVWIIPVIWILLILVYIFTDAPYPAALAFFLFCAILANNKIKHINKLHREVNQMDKILSVYSRLINIIENASFETDFLKRIKSSFETTGVKSSVAIKKLSKHLHALDQRANLFTAIINIFTMRDIRILLNIEKWNAAYGEHIAGWIDTLGEFDALLSLGNFAFNHPGYIYPEITESYFMMEGKALGHPLLHRDVCVCNDISIRQAPQFMIVTGANMAGKSTYLRTVGMNYLLACIGAPAFAEKLCVFPASLTTSLRTSDSLVANESYFYAELKRLKTIIDRLNTGEKLFIILDEILKGTNSDDKQKGSLALIRQFISYRACGIIATHDLVLGTLQQEFPDYVKNYRFEADIEADKLSFSYKLQEGIARNLNACFLMEKMGITM